MRSAGNDTASRPRATERVKVFCRLRPLLQREKDGWSYDEYTQRCSDDARPERSSDEQPEQCTTETFVTDTEKVNLSGTSANSVVVLADDGRTVRYTQHSSGSEPKDFVFDASLSETASQELVYALVARDIVRDVLEGFNGTIFAYGQTATGKTHTMVGSDENDLTESDGRGIIPRALEEIFQSAEQSKATITTSVALSYVQIYCERVFDLLDPETPPASIVIREDPDRGVYLDGASCTLVSSATACLQLLERANANRAVATTAMNAHSSRSHAVLILRVERKELPVVASVTTLPGSAAPPPPHQTIKSSNLYLVDLAGSERVKKAKVVGRHVSELKAINLSLSALGNCIAALSKQRAHVPYRDSKLTRLLQSSLGGNAKTALVVTLSPSPTEALETLATLQFGQRAMQVAVRAHCNVLSVLDYKSLYEDAQQRLDAAGETTRGLETEALARQLRVAQVEDELLKARMRIQHLEFENQAGNAALAALSVSSETGPSAGAYTAAADAALGPGLPQQLAELVAQHDSDVRAMKATCDVQVATYKTLAEQAAQEWHETEDALASEKEQVLRALQELKEFKLRFFELEDDTTDRIAELVQDAKETEREMRESAENAAKQIKTLTLEISALRKQLSDAECERKRLQETMDTDFVPRDTLEQMEALYEKAIAKLQQRVGTLETKAAATSAPPQRKVVVVSPPPSNQAPERANIGGPQSSKAGAKASTALRAVPKIGRLVPGSKAASAPNGLL